MPPTPARPPAARERAGATCQSQSGFTLIELLASMAITAILTVGIVSTITRFMSAFQLNSLYMKASQVSEALLEDFMQDPDPFNKATSYNYNLGPPARPFNPTPSELTGAALLPGVKTNLDNAIWQKKSAQGQVQLETSVTYRSIVDKLLAVQRVTNSGTAFPAGTIPRQPLPPDPTVVASAPPVGFPMPTLLGLSVRTQIYDRHSYEPLQSGGLGMGVTAPLLAESQSIVVQNPRQFMIRTGSEAFRAIDVAGAISYRPVTLNDATQDPETGQVRATVDGWTLNFDTRYASTAETGQFINYKLMVQTPANVYSVGPSEGAFLTTRTYQYKSAHALGLTVAYPNAGTLPNPSSGSLLRKKWHVEVSLGSNNSYSTLVFDPLIPVTTKGFEQIIPLYNPDGTVSAVTAYYNVIVRVSQTDAPQGGTGEIRQVRFVY